MTEMTLEDVIVRVVPSSGEPPELADERVRVVLLREAAGARRLPIWIGAAEGDALALQLGGEALPRPLTPDLMARLLEAAGARVERVTIASLSEHTFFATIAIAVGGDSREVDARPSDALNLAARVRAPIYVDDDVLERAGIASDELDRELDELRERIGMEEGAPGEWQSLSPELVKSLHPVPGKK